MSEMPDLGSVLSNRQIADRFVMRHNFLLPESLRALAIAKFCESEEELVHALMAIDRAEKREKALQSRSTKVQQIRTIRNAYLAFHEDGTNNVGSTLAMSKTIQEALAKEYNITPK